MTTPANGTESKELQRDIASSELIDAIIARTANSNVKQLPVSLVPEAPHPLDGIDDVDKAKAVIVELLAKERRDKQIKVYPRTILRQQHIVAYMLVNPFATTPDICGFFGISPTTLSNIAKSDTFKAMINAHKASVESIMPDIQDQLRMLLSTSMAVVGKAVVERGTDDAEFALATMKEAGNKMGLGARHQTAVQINNTVVTQDMIEAARARKRIGGNAG